MAHGWDMKNDIIRLGETLADEANRASDLWSWLPSHGHAEQAHGDYAGNFQPTVADIMIEATMVLSALAGYAQNKAEVVDRFQCGCDPCVCGRQDIEQTHGITAAGEIAAWFEAKYGRPLKYEEPKR